jgi:hypothetical protein
MSPTLLRKGLADYHRVFGEEHISGKALEADRSHSQVQARLRNAAAERWQEFTLSSVVLLLRYGAAILGTYG